MGTARELTDLKGNFTEVLKTKEIDLFDDDMEFTEELIFDDRLNALINRKLEEAQESLHCGGKRYSLDEVDDIIEKIILRAEQNV